MNKLNFTNLTIEITRKCNMKCDHCLRGRAENVDLSIENIFHLASRVKGIDTLTITGGEPSLRPYIINRLVDAFKSHKVKVNRFYMATNASFRNMYFIETCLNLYTYCLKEDSKVEYSNDYFHRLNKDQVKLLSCLNFVSPRYHEANYYSIEKRNTYLLKQGRQKTGRKVKECMFGIHEDNSIIFLNDIYVNAHGGIINGCDWSYNNQFYYKICDVWDMSLDKFKEYSLKKEWQTFTKKENKND